MELVSLRYNRDFISAWFYRLGRYKYATIIRRCQFHSPVWWFSLLNYVEQVYSQHEIMKLLPFLSCLVVNHNMTVIKVMRSLSRSLPGEDIMITNKDFVQCHSNDNPFNKIQKSFIRPSKRSMYKQISKNVNWMTTSRLGKSKHIYVTDNVFNIYKVRIYIYQKGNPCGGKGPFIMHINSMLLMVWRCKD